MKQPDVQYRRRRRQQVRYGCPAVSFNVSAFTTRTLLAASCFVLAFTGVKHLADVYGFRADSRRFAASARWGTVTRQTPAWREAVAPGAPVAARTPSSPADSALASRAKWEASAQPTTLTSLLAGWNTGPLPVAPPAAASAPALTRVATAPVPTASGGGFPVASHPPASVTGLPVAARVGSPSNPGQNAALPANVASLGTATLAGTVTATVLPGDGSTRPSGFHTSAVTHRASVVPQVGTNFTWTATPVSEPTSTTYNWTNGANWTGGTAPGPTDQQAINFTPATESVTPSVVNTSYVINSLTFQTGTQPYTITNSNSATLTVGAGGVTNNSANGQTLALPVNVAGSQTFNSSAFSGGLTVTGPLALSAGSSLRVAGPGTTEFSGSVGGSGSITVNAESTLILSGTTANTYTGVTAVQGTAYLEKTGGAIAVAGDLAVQGGYVSSGGDQIAATSNLTVGGGGEFSVASFVHDAAEAVASLNGDVNGTVTLGSQFNTGRLTVGQGHFDGLIRDGFLSQGIVANPSADGTSGGELIKAGGGVLTLTHNNTYSNGTTVTGGTLLINNVPGEDGNSGTGSGTVRVLGGGRLGGFGVIAGAVTVGGGEGIAVLAPGDGLGRLTLLSSLTLTSNARVELELGGPLAGINYDQVYITGDLTLSGTLNVRLVNGFVPFAGEKFYVLDGTDAPPSELTAGSVTTNGVVSGGFVNVAADGTYRDAAGNLYLVNYADSDPGDPTGTTGNDVSLTFIGVPEPGTLAWCGLGLALACGLARRQKISGLDRSARVI